MAIRMSDMKDTFTHIAMLVNKINEQYGNVKFDGIICVGRGGMVPARLLSDELGLPAIVYLPLTSYKHGTTEQGVVKSAGCFMPSNVSYGNWLVVDDLIDSGTTYEYVMNLFKDDDRYKLVYAVLLLKNKEYVDKVVYARQVPKDEWVVFSWDAAEYLRKRNFK